jgi:UDP-N-acetylmuramoyl-tripeptide--D-alanyl-D-alanine ligase
MPPTVTDAPHDQEASVDAALRCVDVVRATGGRAVRTSGRPVRGAAVDSRRVEANNAFFALPGEHTDGHEHLRDAVERGAAALIVSRDLHDAALDALWATPPGGVSIIRVVDGMAALHALAGAWRMRFDPLVVGVTGSLAKTSTKEAVATVLSAAYRVLRSPGNENNEVGVPLTLLRLQPEHRVVVLEMGMYVRGDIGALAALARPRIGVVTAVRGVHVERAGSIDAIEAGKAELVEALPADGVAILNADDERVLRMAARTRARILTYGFGPADVSALDVLSLGAEGMRFVLRLPGDRELAVRLPVLGRHGVHNALAGAAVGIAAGLDPRTIVAGLERGWHAPHRGELRRVGPWLVLDDTYNAGPDSMAAALDLLGTIPGRRIAVLGEMLELGPESAELHAAVGARAAVRADLLVTIGEAAALIAEGARAAGMPPDRTVESRDLQDALVQLLAHLASDDVVLFKASRGLGLDPGTRSSRGLGLDDLIGALERSAQVAGSAIRGGPAPGRGGSAPGPV